MIKLSADSPVSYLEDGIVTVDAKFAGWLGPVHGSPEVLNGCEGEDLLCLPVLVLVAEPPRNKR